MHPARERVTETMYEHTVTRSLYTKLHTAKAVNKGIKYAGEKYKQNDVYYGIALMCAKEAIMNESAVR